MLRELKFIWLLLFIGCTLVNSQGLKAQYKSKWHLRGYAQGGQVFITNSFLKGENFNQQKVDRFWTISIQAGKQTHGLEEWQAIWLCPSYGLGISMPDFYIEDELGRPVTIYGYFIAPFKRWKRFSLNYEIGFGIAFNWKRYHTETNPHNVAIGSYASLFADWGINMRYSVSRNLDLDAGVTLSHFSNGAMAMPNKGINTIAPRIAARYNFRKSRPAYKPWEVPAYVDNWELQIFLAGAVKAVPLDTSSVISRKSILGVRFGIATLDAFLVRQISHKVKLGAGIDLAYNPASNAQYYYEGGEIIKNPADFSYRFSLAAVGSLEFVFHRLSIIIQPGYYVLRKKYDPQPPAFFQRVGLKYHFTKKASWFAGVTVRAYDFQVADFVEWTVGHRIQWKKK